MGKQKIEVDDKTIKMLLEFDEKVTQAIHYEVINPKLSKKKWEQAKNMSFEAALEMVMDLYSNKNYKDPMNKLEKQTK